jgi:DGQHR domain-containing protein
MTRLDDVVYRLFKDSGIACYDVRSHQIQQARLGYDSSSGEHLEFDFLCKIGKVGLIIESTSQKRKQRTEITKFGRHCSAFINSKVELDKRLRLFGLQKAAREEFGDVEKWKAVYIGTSEELIGQRFSPPTTPGVKCTVLNVEHLEYLKFLVERIGNYAKSELLNILEISPHDANEDIENIEIEPIRILNRKISKGMGSVDLYIFTACVANLLKIARVVRYGSPKEPVPELGTEAYQRLLSQDKLGKIQAFINKEKKHTAFPNAITIVLSKLQRHPEQDDKWLIPIEYGSVEVIDGQHRLFAFARSKLTENQLRAIRLTVVGIKFRDETRRRQFAARAFVEINREQTKVPTELVTLIANRVMGETSPVAIAGRVLIDLNIGVGPLANVFKTRPFITKNRVGLRPVRMVTVTNELSHLFGLQGVFSVSVVQPLGKEKARKIISEGRGIVNRYFSDVSTIFDKDWKSSESLLLSAKYLSAFCFLLVDFKRQRRGDESIRNSLTRLQKNISRHIQRSRTPVGPNGELLHNANQTLPDLRKHLSDIKNFIEGHRVGCKWSSAKPYA